MFPSRQFWLIELPKGQRLSLQTTQTVIILVRVRSCNAKDFGRTFQFSLILAVKLTRDCRGLKWWQAEKIAKIETANGSIAMDARDYSYRGLNFYSSGSVFPFLPNKLSSILYVIRRKGNTGNSTPGARGLFFSFNSSYNREHGLFHPRHFETSGVRV